MKLNSTIALFIPVLVLATGCALIPGHNKDSDEVVVVEAEPAPSQIQSTFLDGDTLWNFAERTTGSGFNWERIKEFNAIKDEKNIDAGIVLFVPPELALESLKNQ